MPLDVTSIVQTARQALAPFGNTLTDAWCALIGDRVAVWRVKNAASLQRAVTAELETMGLRLRHAQIPERYALAWFEEATKQDEEEIQVLFARLLARAASGDEDASDRRHLQILTHFTPSDAKAFHWFFSRDDPEKHPSFPEYDLWRRAKDELGEASWLSIEHLMSLGVIERRFDLIHREAEFLGRESWTAAAELTATERGSSLFRACNAPTISPGESTPLTRPSS
ncbi:MAG TPA: hypothetical protein VGC56_03980 [Allosphingosinicella sp.]|jgi:hypothetical protein